MEGGESSSISGLLPQEGEVVDEDAFVNITQTCSSGSEDEYVEMLIEREISFGFRRGQSLVLDARLKYARLDAISWVLKNRSILGFRLQTAFLSIAYFDRFLSRRQLDSEKLWTVKLLSTACLSLAAKVEEIKTPPPLSVLQHDGYNFDNRSIRRMELLVLSKLEWRMMPVTPFAFLRYFIIKFYEESPPRHVLSKTAGIIFATTREINLLDHRPSVLAAAATLVALDQNFTRKALECKMESISCSRFLEFEDVFQCYNLMKKLDMDILKKIEHLYPPRLSPAGSLDVVENSSATSNVPIRRKRPASSHYDQDHQ